MPATTLNAGCDSARIESLPLSSANHRCVLALERGTTSGRARRDQDGLMMSGTESFRPRRYGGGCMR